MQENAKTAEDFGNAVKLFERIGDYADCRARAESCRNEAERLTAETKRNEQRKQRNIRIAVALVVVLAIATMFLLTRVILPSRAYSKAEALLAAGDYAAAAEAFAALGDYKDAKERSFELWNTVAVRDTVSAGYTHTVGLRSDGTVVAVGRNYDGRCNVSDWTDIVAISAGRKHTVGLKSDGTVVAVGDNEYGQCDVSGWTVIKIPN